MQPTPAHGLSDLSARLEFALDAARAAGELILGYYRDARLQVEFKADRSPVTAADRGAEELLRARIAAEFPGDGVLGEELADVPSRNGYRWVLDPVDGTKSFIHGVPLFGTLIGLERDGRVLLGVCRFPALDEVVYAARGGGAWWRIGDAAPRAVRVSPIDRIEDALFCITTVSGWEKIGRRDAFDRLCGAAGLTRGWGDCYGHMLVATGRAEVMIDTAMNPWDAAAVLPIVEEAGGHFLDWTGTARIDGGNGLSVNAALRETICALLNGEG
ncbi:MAG: histidinol-phosphatase [Planctomycetales bacterium]